MGALLAVAAPVATAAFALPLPASRAGAGLCVRVADLHVHLQARDLVAAGISQSVLHSDGNLRV